MRQHSSATAFSTPQTDFSLIKSSPPPLTEPEAAATAPHLIAPWDSPLKCDIQAVNTKALILTNDVRECETVALFRARRCRLPPPRWRAAHIFWQQRILTQLISLTYCTWRCPLALEAQMGWKWHCCFFVFFGQIKNVHSQRPRMYFADYTFI